MKSMNLKEIDPIINIVTITLIVLILFYHSFADAIDPFYIQLL